jgi:proteasome accessory factor A
VASRVFGIETEYAVSQPDASSDGIASEPGEVVMQQARVRLPHLAVEGGAGIFLTNASRLYRDVGGHVELATCEVDSPDDLVRYAAAGDTIVAKLAEEISSRRRGAGAVVISKCNVDYLQPGVCWAAHESYCHRADLRRLPALLIPHLVSRIIYCGAGGLNPPCPGIQPTLSPRAHIFCKAVSNSTTSDRGIYNTREEPLCGDGHQRLHVICGDSLSSQHALWLKVATTAIVVAMIEAGIDPTGGIHLKHPVAALHAFALDPYFRTKAELTNGPPVTAIEIQRSYLQSAIQHGHHPAMPPWTEQVCQRWAQTLELLGQGPAAIEGMFDWSIKYPLLLAHARRRGVDPQSLPHWNQCLTSLRDHLRSKAMPERLSADLILRHPGPLAEHVGFLGGYLAEHGLRWPQVRDVLGLRDELCEIDMRFGQVYPPGLFAALEENLRHRVVEVSSTAGCDGDPRTSPPKSTRARHRGAAVRRYAGQGHVTCDWDHVRNGGRVLDLSDPRGQGARWKITSREHPRTTPPAGGPVPPAEMLRLLRDIFDGGVARGDSDRAYDLLREVAPSAVELIHENSPARPSNDAEAAANFEVLIRLARAQSRRGCSDEALAALDRASRMRPANSPGQGQGGGIDFRLACEYVAVHRQRALVPAGGELNRWIDAADRARSGQNIPPAQWAAFRGHKAYALCRAGRHEEARDLLMPLCETESADIPARIRARNLAELGDISRALGQDDQAVAYLDRAERLQTRCELFEDLADYTLTCRFKLAPRSRGSALLLRRIKQAQHALNCRVGLIRSLLLEARFRPSRFLSTRRRRTILTLAEEIPDLMSCPTMTHILENWACWQGGQADPADPNPTNPDPFWGV